jgi:hypothetical protein
MWATIKRWWVSRRIPDNCDFQPWTAAELAMFESGHEAAMRSEPYKPPRRRGLLRDSYASGYSRAKR